MSTSVPASTYAAVLALPRVRFVFASALVGRFAYPLVGLPLLFAVEEATTSFSAAGVATGAYGATAGFLAPARARVLDRFGYRRGLLIFAALFAVSLVALALVTHERMSAPWCIAVAGIAGAVAPPLGPTMRVIWATLTPSPDLLRRALSLDAVLEEVLFLAGPALSGFLLVGVSAAAALLVPAVLVAVGTLLMVSSEGMRVVGTQAPPNGDQDRAVTLLSEPRFIAVLLPVLATGLVVGGIYVAVPALAATVGGTAGVGVVLALFAGGSAAGGLIYGALNLRSSPGRQILVLTTMLVTASAVTSLADSMIVLGMILALAGLFLSPIMIAAYFAASGFGGAARQVESTTWVNTSHNVGAAAGSAAAGFLVEAWGVSSAFVGSAIVAGLLLLVGVAVYACCPALSRGQRVDQIRRRARGPVS